MKDFKVSIDNVKECWQYYEEYKEEENKLHYSDTNYQEFESWCKENLMECPNCGDIVLKDEQEHLNEPYNPDNVCDWCIEELDYGK